MDPKNVDIFFSGGRIQDLYHERVGGSSQFAQIRFGEKTYAFCNIKAQIQQVFSTFILSGSTLKNEGFMHVEQS